MDVPTARLRLGVGAETSWEEIRRAYRRQVRAVHPDRAEGPADAAARTRATAELSVAYATLASHHRRARPVRAAADVAPDVRPASGAELRLEVPPGEALMALMDAAHHLGEVSYVDRGSGVLEVIVTDGPGRATSLLILVEGDSGGSRAELGVEPLGRHAVPDVHGLAARLAGLLTRRS